jgi:hypothetical protein
VPEHQATYDSLYRAAAGALERQRRRAQSLLDSTGAVKDFRYWFAKVYSYVTEMELQFVQARAYYYPSYVLRSVLYFEQIYDDNFTAFSAGARVEDHWRNAFERMARDQQQVRDAERMATDPAILGPRGEPGATGARGGLALNAVRAAVEHAADALVAGMQAHIRYDLPRAENWVFSSYYASVPGIRQEDFRPDFFNMAGVFDEAGRRMNADMAARLHIPVHAVPQMLQDLGMRYYFDADMVTERADTWRRAEELGGRATRDPYRIQEAGVGGSSVTETDNLAGLRSLPTAGLRPSMSSSAAVPDDEDVRARLGGLSPSAVASLPAMERVAMLRGLLRGATLDDDEEAILRILRGSRSAGDLPLVVDAVDPWDLLFAVDGEEYDSLRDVLRGSYYPAVEYQTAQRIVVRCIDGDTAGWEERMIVDLIEARPRTERRRLLEHLGRTRGASERGSDAQRGAAVLRDNLSLGTRIVLDVLVRDVL